METVRPPQPAQSPAAQQGAAAPPQPGAPARLSTPMLIATMLKSAPNTSDLVFSPGRPPQVKVNGKLIQVKIQGMGLLTPAETAQIAADLMGRHAQSAQK